MPRVNPDAGLEVALDQRRQRLDQERQVLAEREVSVQQELGTLAQLESRVQMVLTQIDAAQNPRPGKPLTVALLGDLERLLQWCEQQILLQRKRVDEARGIADEARGAVATAHQQVRALELVLEGRAAERAEKRRRAELREADETAARVHASNQGAR